jgi:hypothetical protein
LLKASADEAQRQTLERLLAEEKAKLAALTQPTPAPAPQRTHVFES